MADNVTITLVPSGESFQIARGTPLKDFLHFHGIEFPCGGRGVCRGCRIRVVEGELHVDIEKEYRLKPDQLADGWRLACMHTAETDLTLEVSHGIAPILTDDSTFAFTPREGYGIAVDLGSTTLAAQLLDLRDARVLDVRTAFNPQARHGADIMSRVNYCVEHGMAELRDIIRHAIGELVHELVGAMPDDLPLLKVTIVGNTPMHNIFCGIDVTPLSHYPFEPADEGLRIMAAADLGWDLEDDPEIHFLPTLGSFVGSDLLAGLLATRLHERPGILALVDLGTNGEIIVSDGARLVCASAAAGPAFEAANIAMGMRATNGAVSKVWLEDERFQVEVIGGNGPRGICGSGLVDAVACSLDLGFVGPSGRIDNHDGEIVLASPVKIVQRDIRELQLAKGAIAVGLRLLLKRLGHDLDDLEHLYLAGAFGNYIRLRSALRIGLFQLPEEKIVPSGNTALLGAKLALFDDLGNGDVYADIISRMTHVGLSSDMEFQEAFVEEMGFPE